jgi:hypothetical protein
MRKPCPQEQWIDERKSEGSNKEKNGARQLTKQGTPAGSWVKDHVGEGEGRREMLEEGSTTQGEDLRAMMVHVPHCREKQSDSETQQETVCGVV